MNTKRALAALCAAGLLIVGTAGCGKAAEKAVQHELKKNGVDVNNNDSTVTFKDDSGNAVTYGTKKLPDGWPKDLKLPDGSTIQIATKSSESGGDSFGLTFTSKKSASDLAKFFRNELKDAGYHKNQESNFGGSDGQSYSFDFLKDGTEVAIVVSSDSDSGVKSSVVMSISPADNADSSGGSPLSS